MSKIGKYLTQCIPPKVLCEPTRNTTESTRVTARRQRREVRVPGGGALGEGRAAPGADPLAAGEEGAEAQADRRGHVPAGRGIAAVGKHLRTHSGHGLATKLCRLAFLKSTAVNIVCWCLQRFFGDGLPAIDHGSTFLCIRRRGGRILALRETHNP